MAGNIGLPPLFGAPWERQEEPDNGRRHGMVFTLTFEGKRLLGRLYQKVQWDDLGMIQTAGTEEDAESIRVLEAVDDGTLPQWLDTPVVGSIVRRRVIGLFEAGYLKSHSLRDI